MITRIEIDGFKTFLGFKMDFAPLTVIAGANASGKSNLFDALELLSRLAETDLKTAFGEQRGQAIELFTQYASGEYLHKMRFGMEMLVERNIRDNWGRTAKLKYTRLRYELEIRRGVNEQGMEDLFVGYEYLGPIPMQEDQWMKNHLPEEVYEAWKSKECLEMPVKPFIVTEEGEDSIKIFLSEAGMEGPFTEGGGPFPLIQTFLSASESGFFPHAFSAKEEMRSWRVLQLDPEQLRRPSPHQSKDILGKRGGNLAATLYRISREDPQALADISRHLANLIPGMVGLKAEDDREAKQYTFKVRVADGREFSSRLLSEGTLRLLALGVLLYDEKHKGLICLEEPENGIHPSLIEALAGFLRDSTEDFAEVEPFLGQVILNTHSPVLLSEIFKFKEDRNVGVWFTQVVSRVGDLEGKRTIVRISNILPVRSYNQPGDYTESEKKLTLKEAVRYLQAGDFAQAIQTLNEP